MIKDFTTYINEGLFDRNQSEFVIKKTDKGIEHVYIPKTKDELYRYIGLGIEQAKKEGSYPNVNLKNIDISELGDDDLYELFGGFKDKFDIVPDISNWNIEYIPNHFFYNNKQIKEFTIPDSVTRIGERSFYNCISLTSVTIPNNVTNIGEGAFTYCSSLTSVEIPDSVTSIGTYAFYGCDDLTSPVYNAHVFAFMPKSYSGSYTIPDGIASITGYAFYDCNSITSVTIPNSVTSIGEGAFGFCRNLTSVTISEHLRISEYSFPKNCKIIRKII